MPFGINAWNPFPSTSTAVKRERNNVLFIRAFAAKKADAEQRSDLVAELCSAAVASSLPIKLIVVAIWCGHERATLDASAYQELQELTKTKLKAAKITAAGIKVEVSKVTGVFDHTGQLLNLGAAYASRCGADGIFSISPAMHQYLTLDTADAVVEAIAGASYSVGLITKSDKDFISAGLLIESFAYHRLLPIAGAALFKAWTSDISLDGTDTHAGIGGAESVETTARAIHLYGPSVTLINATKIAGGVVSTQSASGQRYIDQAKSGRLERYQALLSPSHQQAVARNLKAVIQVA